MISTRRSFLIGLAAGICAPAIVRVGSLMPVRAPELVVEERPLYVHRLVVDKVIGFPVNLWLSGETYQQVLEDTHPRYRLIRSTAGSHDQPRLAVPEPGLRQAISQLRQGQP